MDYHKNQFSQKSIKINLFSLVIQFHFIEFINNTYMARIFYWEMVFSPTLGEKRPAIKNKFQVKFSQIN